MSRHDRHRERSNVDYPAKTRDDRKFSSSSKPSRSTGRNGNSSHLQSRSDKTRREVKPERSSHTSSSSLPSYSDKRVDAPSLNPSGYNYLEDGWWKRYQVPEPKSYQMSGSSSSFGAFGHHRTSHSSSDLGLPPPLMSFDYSVRESVDRKMARIQQELELLDRAEKEIRSRNYDEITAKEREFRERELRLLELEKRLDDRERDLRSVGSRRSRSPPKIYGRERSPEPLYSGRRTSPPRRNRVPTSSSKIRIADGDVTDSRRRRRRGGRGGAEKRKSPADDDVYSTSSADRPSASNRRRDEPKRRRTTLRTLRLEDLMQVEDVSDCEDSGPVVELNEQQKELAAAIEASGDEEAKEFLKKLKLYETTYYHLDEQKRALYSEFVERPQSIIAKIWLKREEKVEEKAPDELEEGECVSEKEKPKEKFPQYLIQMKRRSEKAYIKSKKSNKKEDLALYKKLQNEYRLGVQRYRISQGEEPKKRKIAASEPSEAVEKPQELEVLKEIVEETSKMIPEGIEDPYKTAAENLAIDEIEQEDEKNEENQALTQSKLLDNVQNGHGDVSYDDKLLIVEEAMETEAHPVEEEPAAVAETVENENQQMETEEKEEEKVEKGEEIEEKLEENMETGVEMVEEAERIVEDPTSPIMRVDEVEGEETGQDEYLDLDEVDGSEDEEESDLSDLVVLEEVDGIDAE
ncbi:unnamed protein product [Caenorhabditis auriculariae]|uniref:Uncharacterized protein n=1 Tax=Caenorhabditis auriculariae TaxID=2777116 RepID=A0A8S1HP91_9PELO|nr:unnamed protein product [Caenorhabditis auriculariae]